MLRGEVGRRLVGEMGRISRKLWLASSPQVRIAGKARGSVRSVYSRGSVRTVYTVAGLIPSQHCCQPARCEFNFGRRAVVPEGERWARRHIGSGNIVSQSSKSRLSFRALGQSLKIQLPRGSNLQKHHLKYGRAFPAFGGNFVAGSRRIPAFRAFKSACLRYRGAIRCAIDKS